MRSELKLSQTIPEHYEEDFRLGHQEMIGFVQMELRKLKTPLIFVFWLLNILILLGLTGLLLYFPVSLSEAVRNTSLGIAFFFVLIPLHELIHGIIYKICGARHVSYHANPRKLVFYALADRFVVCYPRFMLIAFGPFIVITTGLLFLIFQGGAFWAWFGWGALLMHTSGCAGDFALASYFFVNRRRQPLTYDIKDEAITVFLLRNTAKK